MEIKMYKKCSKCKKSRLYSQFSKNRSAKDGRQNQCKICVKHRIEANKEQIAIKKKQYYEDNKEQRLDYRKQYAECNKEQITQYQKHYRKQYCKTNSAKINAHAAKRRAIKLRATPQWLTKEHFLEIEDLFICAKMFRLYTGQEYHVDHIIPLKGKNVCGLHVPWNLQILEASENIRKSNKLWQ